MPSVKNNSQGVEVAVDPDVADDGSVVVDCCSLFTNGGKIRVPHGKRRKHRSGGGADRRHDDTRSEIEQIETRLASDDGGSGRRPNVPPASSFRGFGDLDGSGEDRGVISLDSVEVDEDGRIDRDARDAESFEAPSLVDGALRGMFDSRGRPDPNYDYEGGTIKKSKGGGLKRKVCYGALIATFFVGTYLGAVMIGASIGARTSRSAAMEYFGGGNGNECEEGEYGCVCEDVDVTVTAAADDKGSKTAKEAAEKAEKEAANQERARQDSQEKAKEVAAKADKIKGGKGAEAVAAVEDAEDDPEDEPEVEEEPSFDKPEVEEEPSFDLYGEVQAEAEEEASFDEPEQQEEQPAQKQVSAKADKAGKTAEEEEPTRRNLRRAVPDEDFFSRALKKDKGQKKGATGRKCVRVAAPAPAEEEPSPPAAEEEEEPSPPAAEEEEEEALSFDLVELGDVEDEETTEEEVQEEGASFDAPEEEAGTEQEEEEEVIDAPEEEASAEEEEEEEEEDAPEGAAEEQEEDDEEETSFDELEAEAEEKEEAAAVEVDAAATVLEDPLPATSSPTTASPTAEPTSAPTTSAPTTPPPTPVPTPLPTPMPVPPTRPTVPTDVCTVGEDACLCGGCVEELGSGLGNNYCAYDQTGRASAPLILYLKAHDGYTGSIDVEFESQGSGCSTTARMTASGVYIVWKPSDNENCSGSATLEPNVFVKRSNEDDPMQIATSCASALYVGQVLGEKYEVVGFCNRDGTCGIVKSW